MICAERCGVVRSPDDNQDKSLFLFPNKLAIVKLFSLHNNYYLLLNNIIRVRFYGYCYLAIRS